MTQTEISPAQVIDSSASASGWCSDPPVLHIWTAEAWADQPPFAGLSSPAQQLVEPQSTTEVLAEWRAVEVDPAVPDIRHVTPTDDAAPAQPPCNLQAMPDLEPTAAGPILAPLTEPEPDDEPSMLRELGIFALAALMAFTIAAVVVVVGISLTV